MEMWDVANQDQTGQPLLEAWPNEMVNILFKCVMLNMSVTVNFQPIY